MRIKPHHILPVSFLLSLGARDDYIVITGEELGRGIQKSQQAASQYLAELESDGLITRLPGGRGSRVRITRRGYEYILEVLSMLESSVRRRPAPVRGILVSGMGEGAYYMGLDGYTRQFRELLGYLPFPGTLNLHLTDSALPDMADGITIRGFTDSDRTFGGIECLAARIGSIPCHVIRPERTHHDSDIIEIISKECIREALSLEDGDTLEVQIPDAAQDFPKG